MYVTLSGIVTPVSAVQLQNASSPISVKPFPKLTSFSDVQKWNAKPSRLVTLSGIVTLVSDLQLLNALFPMLVTPSGIVTSVSAKQ